MTRATRENTNGSQIGLPAGMTPDDAYVQGVADGEKSATRSLVDDAKRIFADDEMVSAGTYPLDDLPLGPYGSDEPDAQAMTDADDALKQLADRPVVTSWRPGRDKMIKVRGGGDYLGVRYRLLWMRREHPLWCTRVEPYLLDWDAGVAIFWGRVYDDEGRLIAEDMKTETRKDFPDFVEKAATGALGRALAGAGYGTEGALELDEGVSQQTGDIRIADAPVNGSKAITITPSSVPGIKQGGRSEHITTAQLQAISRRSKELGLGAAGMARFIGDDKLVASISSMDTETDQQRELLAFLKGYSFEAAASLIDSLTSLP